MHVETATFTALMLMNATIEHVSFINESTNDYVTTDGLSGHAMASLHEEASSGVGTFTPTTESHMNETTQLAINEADVKRFSYLTRTFINPVICAFGFVSNSLGVGVLKTQARQQKLSIFWYLFAITIADIVFLGLGIVDCIPRLGHVIGIVDADRSKYLTAHFRTVQSFFDQTSLHSARYIVVVMSIERLISVMNPLHVKDMCFAKYPIKIVIACVIFNALLALPLLIFPTVITVQKGVYFHVQTLRRVYIPVVNRYGDVSQFCSHVIPGSS